MRSARVRVASSASGAASEPGPIGMAGATPASVLETLRGAEVGIPLAVMTYYNIAFHMGLERFAHELQAVFTQSKERGARPIVHAATDPAVRTGEFWGPAGLLKGPPRLATPAAITMDAGIRGRIWRDCAAVTGVDWPIAAVASRHASGK